MLGRECPREQPSVKTLGAESNGLAWAETLLTCGYIFVAGDRGGDPSWGGERESKPNPGFLQTLPVSHSPMIQLCILTMSL